MTDVAVADMDKFCGGRGKGCVPFRTFDAAFRARCVNRDLSHVLDDTDPNSRPQRTADVMMDDPEGVIDPTTGTVRKIGKGKARRGSRFDDGAYSASDSESGDEFSFGVARSATALSAGD